MKFPSRNMSCVFYNYGDLYTFLSFYYSTFDHILIFLIHFELFLLKMNQFSGWRRFSFFQKNLSYDFSHQRIIIYILLHLKREKKAYMLFFLHIVSKVNFSSYFIDLIIIIFIFTDFHAFSVYYLSFFYWFILSDVTYIKIFFFDDNSLHLLSFLEFH